MPWEKVSLRKFAKQLGVDYQEVKEKQRLIELITRVRNTRGLTQSALARKLGISQPRMAKIESGIGTKQVSFDLLFRILSALGYSYKITAKRGKMAA